MSHLNLSQSTSSVEVVSSVIIDKLYELAQTNLDESSDVQGNIQVNHAYEDAVTYLLNKFPNLQINVTSGAYIRFADSAVAAICASNWGDSVGITLSQAQALTSLNNKFNNNTFIRSFNELFKFINIKVLSTLEFNGCSNLTSIRLDNITSIGVNCFNSCIHLQSVFNTQLITTIGSTAFYGCTLLTSLSFQNLITCAYGAFKNCTSLLKFNIGDSCTLIGDQAFYGCTTLQYVICNAVTPPTLSATSAFQNTTCKIYVPNDSVAAYRAATNWSTYSSRIFSLTQFAIDFPNG